MKTCVMFLITGPSHLPNLLVSMPSLREYWGGDILLFAWPESYDIAQQIALDKQIRAIPVKCDAEYKRKNAQEMAKIDLIYRHPLSEYDVVVYLDADIRVDGRIDAIAESAYLSLDGLAATQFCDWTMKQGIPYKRVARLRDYSEIEQQYVELSLLPHMPSYNSGIFACRPTSPALPVWQKWTSISRRVYISGETCLHPIMQKYKGITMSGRVWNCSTMESFRPKDLRPGETVIWHFHGDSNLRPDKSQMGYQMWWPSFTSALRENIGDCQQWIDSIPNEHLQALRKAEATA